MTSDLITGPEPSVRVRPQFWACASGRWCPPPTSGCGSNQFCRNWTLVSGSSFRRSKRTTVTVFDDERSDLYSWLLCVLTLVFSDAPPLSERRVSQAQQEHETIEADLSSMFPKVSARKSKPLKPQQTTCRRPDHVVGGVAWAGPGAEQDMSTEETTNFTSFTKG